MAGKVALGVAMAVLLWGLPLAGQSPAKGTESPGEAEDPALRWDRDFDLLLDMGEVPSVQDLKRERRRRSLLSERDELRRELADLEARKAAVSSSYGTEGILDEMMRLDVQDLQSVQKVLSKKVLETRRRLEQVERELARLPRAKEKEG